MDSPDPTQQPRSLRTAHLAVPGALQFWKLAMDLPVKVADLRRSYNLSGLAEADCPTAPAALFARWFSDAAAALEKPFEPNAMTLATVGEDGRPEARTVLLKGFDARGLVFYTNYESRKGRALAAHPHASLLFHWEQLERQVEVRGSVERTAPEETAEYFRSRPVGSQIGAWASPQSRPLADRRILESAAEELMARYAGREIPVPPHWGGFRVVPESFEFWQGRPSRLHDRLRYTLETGGAWRLERFAP